MGHFSGAALHRSIPEFMRQSDSHTISGLDRQMLPRSQTPDIRVLQAFEAAARHESFTQAAIELNLTQGAVSKQVRDLENLLQMKLFDRARQRVRLTDTARHYLTEVRAILDRLENATADLMSLRGQSKVLGIATLPTFGARWLMPRIGDFMAQCPSVQIDVSTRAEKFDFSKDRIDIAIHYGLPDWPDADCAFLCSERVVPVATPILSAKAQEIGSIGLAAWAAQSGNAPLLHLKGRPQLWEQWFQATGQPIDHAHAGPRLEEFNLLIAAAMAGIGVALIPTYLIEQELATGQLAALSATGMETDRNYYVVTPTVQADPALTAQFRDWIEMQVTGNKIIP
jgi:LysR family transcriptional regulator, glycine cleavage system transcriptional activator